MRVYFAGQTGNRTTEAFLRTHKARRLVSFLDCRDRLVQEFWLHPVASEPPSPSPKRARK